MAKHARDNHRSVRAERWSWKKPVTVLGVAALTAGTLIGVAAADPNSTTDVGFTPLNPVGKVLTNSSIAAHKTVSAIAVGGATTVPTNATTVQLKVVVVGGTAAGTLDIYPAGNVTGGSGQSVTWGAHLTVSATFEENVGIKDELTFVNNSAATAKVTATVIGYSSQVTTGDISPNGGTAGQVLTNTGAGTAWQSTAQGTSAYASSFSGSVGTDTSTIGALTVPAGSYLVSVTANPFSPAVDSFVCVLESPSGTALDAAFADTVSSVVGESMAAQGLLTTTGGDITWQCRAAVPGTMAAVVITALQVGAVHGAVTTNAHSASVTR
jgi:hypothetical protein